MDPNLDALARELTALTQRFADLGAKLGDAARALEEAGAPPADVLVADLAGARSKFLELRTDVLIVRSGDDVVVLYPAAAVYIYLHRERRSQIVQPGIIDG